MPVSTTAIVVALEPSVMSHAAGALIFAQAHCWPKPGSLGMYVAR